jgi:hypothetical protein
MEMNQIFSLIQTGIVLGGIVRLYFMLKQLGSDCNSHVKYYMEANSLNEKRFIEENNNLQQITLRLKEEHETLKKTIYQLAQEVLYVKEKLKAVSRENAKKSIIEKDKDGIS